MKPWESPQSNPYMKLIPRQGGGSVIPEEEKLKEFDMEKPIKTPVGMVLERLGYPQERLTNVLSNPYAGLIEAQKSGQFYSSKPIEEVEAQNKIVGTVGKAVASLLPYQTTPQDMAMGAMEIKAFHGSPYKFNKFENKAIGTGEGAQAFGYGHYVTESPEVAKIYAKNLGDIEIKNWSVKDIPLYQNKKPFDYSPKTNDPIAHSKAVLQENLFIEEGKVREAFSKSRQDGLKEIQRVFDDTIEQFSSEPYYQGAGIDYLKSRKPKTLRDISYQVKKNEHVYETTIHKGKQPSEYTYLEWDKKVSNEDLTKIGDELGKQFGYRIPGGAATETLKEYLTDVAARKGLPLTGHALYAFLERHLLGGKQASEFLNKAGFHGIKYPTGSLSGSKPTGKYNYVVFNPEDITIEKVK